MPSAARLTPPGRLIDTTAFRAKDGERELPPGEVLRRAQPILRRARQEYQRNLNRSIHRAAKVSGVRRHATLLLAMRCKHQRRPPVARLVRARPRAVRRSVRRSSARRGPPGREPEPGPPPSRRQAA